MHSGSWWTRTIEDRGHEQSMVDAERVDKCSTSRATLANCHETASQAACSCPMGGLLFSQADASHVATWDEIYTAAYHLYEMKMVWNAFRLWRWACRLSGLERVAAAHCQVVRLDKHFKVLCLSKSVCSESRWALCVNVTQVCRHGWLPATKTGELLTHHWQGVQVTPYVTMQVTRVLYLQQHE